MLADATASAATRAASPLPWTASATSTSLPETASATWSLPAPTRVNDADCMHARHYNPLVGRFLSVDPLAASPRRPQSWNRYTYVEGGPLSYVDPTGMGKVGFVMRLIGKAGVRREAKVPVRSYQELRALQSQGEDIAAASEGIAYRVARDNAPGLRPIKEGPHRPGQKPHYHPGDRSGGHIFFSVAGWLTASYWARGHGSFAEAVAEFVDIANPLALGQDLIDLSLVWDEELQAWIADLDVTSGALKGLSPHSRSVPADALYYSLAARGHHTGDFVSTHDLFHSGAMCIEGICM